LNIFDKAYNFIHESSFGFMTTAITNQLRKYQVSEVDLGFSLTSGASGGVGDPKDQVNHQVSRVQKDRTAIINAVEQISQHYLATTIKNVIMNECFRSFCDRSFVSITYKSGNKEVDDLYTEQMAKFHKRTRYLHLLKDSLQNEGFDYGEIFYSIETETGVGITKIKDNIDVKTHLALYEGLTPIGFVKFNTSKNIVVTKDNYVPADKMVHFVLSPRKISLNYTVDFGKEYTLSSKVRCALPFLYPVVDLILNYDSLLELSSALELANATRPIVIGVGVNPVTDPAKVRQELQARSVILNSSRKNIIENINTLNRQAILEKMNEVMLVPYDVENGANRLQQVELSYTQTDLSEKLNHLLIRIARAIPIPESTIASSVIKEGKEEALSFDPAFSRMISSVQQNLSDGLKELEYRNLVKANSALDSSGEEYLLRHIDKDFIDIRFTSTTNLDDRLERQLLLLTSESFSSLISNADIVGGSPNLPIKVNPEPILKVWKQMSSSSIYPDLSDWFSIDTSMVENPEEDLSDKEDIAPPEEEQTTNTPVEQDLEVKPQDTSPEPKESEEEDNSNSNFLSNKGYDYMRKEFQ